MRTDVIWSAQGLCLPVCMQPDLLVAPGPQLHRTSLRSKVSVRVMLHVSCSW